MKIMKWAKNKTKTRKGKPKKKKIIRKTNKNCSTCGICCTKERSNFSR